MKTNYVVTSNPLKDQMQVPDTLQQTVCTCGIQTLAETHDQISLNKEKINLIYKQRYRMYPTENTVFFSVRKLNRLILCRVAAAVKF